jgi:flagellar biosynthetic protein FliQ
MSPDHALALFLGMLQATATISAPVLIACLIGGSMVGIMQTATQINEASISYVVKAVLVVGALALSGPTIADKIVTYTRASIQSIEHVAE